MALTYAILHRAGWHCEACGCETPKRLRGTFEPNAPELDHKIPLSRGGTHDSDNLQCLCRTCNLSKGAKLMSEWRPGLAAAA